MKEVTTRMGRPSLLWVFLGSLIMFRTASSIFRSLISSVEEKKSNLGFSYFWNGSLVFIHLLVMVWCFHASLNLIQFPFRSFLLLGVELEDKGPLPLVSSLSNLVFLFRFPSLPFFLFGRCLVHTYHISALIFFIHQFGDMFLIISTQGRKTGFRFVLIWICFGGNVNSLTYTVPWFWKLVSKHSEPCLEPSWTAALVSQALWGHRSQAIVTTATW